MRETRIIGVGTSLFGRFPDQTEESLGQVAVMHALKDACIELQDIDACFCGNVFGSLLPGHRVMRRFHHSGIPIVNVNNACASGATALNLALSALASGQYETVLVFGVDQLSRLGGGTLPLDKEDVWASQGMTMPALYAMRATRYLHERSVDVSLLASVAVKNRYHGSLNPIAQFGVRTTVKEVLSSRPVAEPFTLYQCCPSSADGAAAVILTSKKITGTAHPIRIAASVIQSGKFETHPVDITAAEITARSAKLAYEASGIDPRDVSLVELHDAFTISELLYYEALGLCDPGGGPELLRSGATTLGGRIPVNVSGGLLAKGHPPGATGIAQIVELVEQLQGRCGMRQVDGARIGLAQVTGGGIWGMDHGACGVHILTK